jgi:hypothetical protein
LLIVVPDHHGAATMDRLLDRAMVRAGFVSSHEGRKRRIVRGPRSFACGLEALESRALLTVENLDGVSAVGASDQAFTQDVATFRDTSPEAVPAESTASIVWGDGSPDAAGTIIEDSSGLFHVSGSHTYASSTSSVFTGPYTISVTLTDSDGTSYATTAAADIDELVPVFELPLNAMQGAPYSSYVISFANANPASAVSDYTSVEIN